MARTSSMTERWSGNTRLSLVNTDNTRLSLVSIETPNYPEAYPNKAKCKWTIKIPKESTVYIYCESFNLEKGDFLRIQKTKYTGLTGDNYTSFEPLTNSKRYNLKLQFKSNKKKTNTGFKC